MVTVTAAAAEAKAKEETEGVETAEEEKQEDKPKAREEDLLSEIVTMNAFTAQALDVLKGGDIKQDAHTVFGLVLFLVGAVQSLRHAEEMSDETFRQVISQTLGGLGLSKDRADHFIDHTDEYLISNPRYSQMFQTGRQSMAAYLEKGTGPRVELSVALSDWASPKGAVGDTSKPVTVLFTDIAGSTAMTQKLGDSGAQEVVRAHNAIVREAIQAFAGKEVKHTGDGIMASFPSAGAGVEAAADMQKRTKAHNKANPELPLGLKIGLNAGEPISEDDDLFGTTVQLAARIVDKAEAGEILVSGSVYGLSQGKAKKFERYADVEMKGFDEPVTIYSAVWDPDAPKPKAKPETKPEAASDAKPEQATAAPSPDAKPDDAPAS
ncbi:adenylate/guanylate cyclase domain-containing protein [Pseudomonadota bacterium]